jgi:phosphoglycerate dehydrogenase-like enzyme
MSTTAKPKAVFLAGPEVLERVFARGRRERAESMTQMHPVVVGPDQLEAELEKLSDVEVAVGTWGFTPMTDQQWDRLPRLKAIFYGAGSVRHFAEPALARGIRVTSSWRANAVPVAEFSLAHILLGCKSYFASSRSVPVRHREAPPIGPGAYDETVALLGAGAIGRKVIELLKPFQLDVIVYDPFLSDEAARTLGVEKVSLEAAFARGQVVSNHLANVPATVGLIRGEHLRSMRPNATFLNTGRGATVREPELYSVLRDRPDLTAVLDVTDPEPPPRDSPLYALPNAVLSPHIAGAINNETLRLADTALDELARYLKGEPLQHEVTAKMLETMA